MTEKPRASVLSAEQHKCKEKWGPAPGQAGDSVLTPGSIYPGRKADQPMPNRCQKAVPRVRARLFGANLGVDWLKSRVSVRSLPDRFGDGRFGQRCHQLVPGWIRVQPVFGEISL